MLSKKLKRIALEYYQKYHQEGISISLKQILEIVETNFKRAKDNYSKLRPPKTSSEEAYITYWVREILQSDFILKTLTPINIKKPPSEPYFQALAEYLSFLPLELIRKLNQEINNTPPVDRKKLWESFNFPVEEAKEKFVKLVVARKNYFLKKQLSLPDTFLGQFKIPKNDYQKFIQNKDKIIQFCNQLLPVDINKLPSWFYSEFNLPCFICQLPKFPFKNFNEAVDFVFQKYSDLSLFKSKVIIKLGESTHVKYEKRTDSFLMTIDKYANARHQRVALIHELSHVINFLKDFQNRLDLLQKGKYYQEKKAIAIEFSILKDLSEDLFRARLSEVLLTFWRIIFEMKLYKNPNQNLGKLYAQTFNLCFKGANQKENKFYLLNEKIITAPFSNLHHAVAYVEILRRKFLGQQK